MGHVNWHQDSCVFQKYLLPQAREHSGVKEDQVNIDRDVIQELIRVYCRESGVRNLQKHVEKVGSSYLMCSLY